MFIVYPGNEKHSKYISLSVINNSKKQLTFFSAQFGGINPSLYLNPEDETKEVCAKWEYYNELGYA